MTSSSSTNKASSDSALWFNVTSDVLPTMRYLTKEYSISVAKRNTPAFRLRLFVSVKRVLEFLPAPPCRSCGIYV